MSAFLSMGGYGAYVWPAYFAAALVLGLLTVWSLRKLKAEARQLERLESQLARHGERRPRPPATSQSAN